MLSIQHRTLDDIAILDLEGRFLADTEHTFWTAVQQVVVEEGKRNVLVNLTSVEMLDSYGISELLKIHNSMTNIGGRMVITNLSDHMKKVLRITKVDEVLLIAESEEEAVAALLTVVEPC